MMAIICLIFDRPEQPLIIIIGYLYLSLSSDRIYISTQRARCSRVLASVTVWAIPVPMKLQSSSSLDRQLDPFDLTSPNNIDRDPNWSALSSAIIHSWTPYFFFCVHVPMICISFWWCIILIWPLPSYQVWQQLLSAKLGTFLLRKIWLLHIQNPINCLAKHSSTVWLNIPPAHTQRPHIPPRKLGCCSLNWA